MEAKKTKFKIDFFWIKAVFFILVTLLCIYGIFTISSQSKITADEVKTLRSQQVGAQLGDQKQVLEAELAKYQEDIDAINSYFPNDTGILELLVRLDNLKNTGVISDFLITSDSAVKDRLGFYGLPLNVTVAGDQNTINAALESLNNLPFLIRPVLLTIERLEDGTLSTSFGGFIYVDKEFNQDR